MNPKKMNLALVVHNHQPVDNDPRIIERIFRRSYRPFLQQLAAFPSVKATLHYSGYLLEWLQETHPEFVSLLAQMVSRGQVEMLGGGYYEPILVSIPDEDAKAQTELLRSKLRSLFGTVASPGIWTAERAWEPHAPEVLRSCGVGFTLLDDTIFTRAGVEEGSCFEPCLVESRGSSVVVFPMSKRLRYLIPWRSPRTSVSYLRGLCDDGPLASGLERIAVFADDGEKFGAWPGTFETVYRDRWLERFFEAIANSDAWLDTVTLSGYLARNTPHSRVYLPSASYDEMMEWALPSRTADRGRHRRASTHIAGGFWRGFLSKYEEGARLYSKMLEISADLHGQIGTPTDESLLELWKGQSNDVYWHGVFGGLYSTHLRMVAHHHLIRAQVGYERLAKGATGSWSEVKEKRFNGYREYSVQTGPLGLLVSPERGGSLAEFSFKEPALQLFDVLTRRPESYHVSSKRSSSKTARQRTKTVSYDRYPKLSFTDYLLEEGAEARSFERQTFRELADLAGQPYEHRSDVDADGRIEIRLERETSDRVSGGALRVEKTLDVSRDEPTFDMKYRVGLQGSQRAGPASPGPRRFAFEVCFGTLGDRGFEKAHTRVAEETSVTSKRLDYPGLRVGVELRFSRPVDVWSVPLFTVSRSESGLEDTLQGVSIVPSFVLSPADEARSLVVKVSASRSA